MERAAANSFDFEETCNTQNGLINYETLNNNRIVTDIEMIEFHFYTAAGVVMGLIIIFRLYACWRVLKKKNMRKICHFCFIQRCRVTQSTFKDVAPHVAYMKSGPMVESVPIDGSRLLLWQTKWP